MSCAVILRGPATKNLQSLPPPREIQNHQSLPRRGRYKTINLSPTGGEIQRGGSSSSTSPTLNIHHALPQFDKEEHMYHIIHERLPAAHSHDNEEATRYGSTWHKYNKGRPRRAMPLRFSNLPCAKRPGRSRELYDNEKNATECNTMQRIFKKSSAGRALTSPSTPTHPVIPPKNCPSPTSRRGGSRTVPNPHRAIIARNRNWEALSR